MLTAHMLSGKQIGMVENFISKAEVHELLSYAKSSRAGWDTSLPPTDVWHARTINPAAMPVSIRNLMIDIRKRAGATIRDQYNISMPLYADTMQIVRWRPGDNQAPHADCEQPDGRPNEFPWRACASIIYLNEDFEGGQIHFPKMFYQPEIKTGMLAFFPSTADYLHGVKEVTAGVRYTLSSFYTGNAARHDGFEFLDQPAPPRSTIAHFAGPKI